MRKWISIIIAAVLAVAIVLGGGFALLKSSRIFKPVDSPDKENGVCVEHVYYLYGGGMDGGMCEITADLDEESGNVKIVIDTREYYGKEENHKEITADRQVMTDVGEVINEYNLNLVHLKGKSRMVVLDAASYDLSVRLSSGKYISVQSCYRLTPKDREGVKKIIEILQNAEDIS